MTKKKTTQTPVVQPRDGTGKPKPTPQRAPGQVGRPPLYEPRYCEMLLDHMKQGGSYETFSAIIGTSRSTLYEWDKSYPQFLEAKRRGLELSQLFYENLGRAGMTGNLKRTAKEVIEKDPVTGKETKITKHQEAAQFNSTAWIFMMKNKFPKDYRDRKEIEHSGGTNNKYSMCSEAEIDRQLKEKVALLENAEEEPSE